LIAFRDIVDDGASSFAQLARQPVPFVTGKSFGGAVHVDAQLERLSPHQQILECSYGTHA
jgi:hypothetical protein